jgi:hypothetical protein
MTPRPGARRRGQIAPRPGLRLEPPVERGALAVLDHPRSDGRGQVRLGELASDPPQPRHGHAAIGGELRE